MRSLRLKKKLHLLTNFQSAATKDLWTSRFPVSIFLVLLSEKLKIVTRLSQNLIIHRCI